MSTNSQIITCLGTQQINKPHVCTECGKAFIKKSRSSIIREFTQEKNLNGCSVCGEAFSESLDSLNTRKPTQERNDACALSVTKSSSIVNVQAYPSKTLQGGGRSPTYVMIVEKALSRSLCLLIIREFIQERNPHGCSLCVTKHSPGSPGSWNTRELTRGEKPGECTECDKAFRWKSQLNAHQKTHRGETLYVAYQERASSRRAISLHTSA